jgi:hypothetical protein
MLDLFGAMKRAARRGRVPADDAQLGFGFAEPASPASMPDAANGGTVADVRHAPVVAPAPAVSPAPVAPLRPSRGVAARRAQAATLLHRLRALGLRGVDTVTLMHTRRTMVSVMGTTLRIHEGYAAAPEPVLRAVVTFATARTRAARLAARDVILGHSVERPPAKRRAEPVRPGDAPLLARLADAHAELNTRHFGGALGRIPVRLSSRMKTRLGHYSPQGEDGPEAEIVLSRRHLRRDGWAEALHTLLHEMIHQWQDETGHPLDHGSAFRRKAREVGVLPRAKRPVG